MCAGWQYDCHILLRELKRCWELRVQVYGTESVDCKPSEPDRGNAREGKKGCDERVAIERERDDVKSKFLNGIGGSGSHNSIINKERKVFLKSSVGTMRPISPLVIDVWPGYTVQLTSESKKAIIYIPFPLRLYRKAHESQVARA